MDIVTWFQDNINSCNRSIQNCANNIPGRSLCRLFRPRREGQNLTCSTVASHCAKLIPLLNPISPLQPICTPLRPSPLNILLALPSLKGHCYSASTGRKTPACSLVHKLPEQSTLLSFCSSLHRQNRCFLSIGLGHESHLQWLRI